MLAQVRAAADQTAQAIRRLVDAEPDGIEVLRRMKFTKIARHPLADRPLNLVEQINQTWTCLVSLRALPFLFERHPDAGGFRLNTSAQWLARISKAWRLARSQPKHSPP